MENKISLKPLSDLLNMEFYVPSYQRGYRWTNVEVRDLLDDLYHFMDQNQTSPKEVFYCLQPLIVYEEEGRFVLIDGQQRLTTIYLILQHLKAIMSILKKNAYSIEYETRPDSADFLDHIDSSRKDDNVDYYHIYQAYRTIEDWFSNKDGAFQLSIVQTLTSDNTVGKNVKVIWYEIDPADAVDIFTRINIGKIRLTNAELIKALFLQQSNFRSGEELRQIQIATEWDIMEKALQNDSFWHFINHSSTSFRTDNRIEFVFDLIKQKGSEHEELYTFHRFNEAFETERKVMGTVNVEAHWLEVKQCFSVLEQWYQNSQLYHYIGFLIEYRYPVEKLIAKSRDLDKDQFVLFVRHEIRSIFRDLQSLDALDFNSGADKKTIRKILLLFNIETLLTTQKAIVRFPFDRYKTEKWDIEHVNSQTRMTLDKSNYLKWASDLLDFFVGLPRYSDEILEDGTTYRERVDAIIDQQPDGPNTIYIKEICGILESEEYDVARVEKLSDDLHKAFKETDIKENNGISNLALLDEGTNRSYKNAMFPIKRKRIIENDKKGLFVPICTKNMFLKYYSRQLDGVMFWQQSDATDYLNALKATLTFYLPQN